jgi:uncharacterized protein
MTGSIARLEQALEVLDPVAVAVSGGVDSMTLAVVAHRLLGSRAEMFHAVSAAVPADATARVRDHARAEGWQLRLIEAGEFDDDAYVANPVDRCFFCKRNLYGTITALTDATVVSGTNTDDLDDYRPGLAAAADAGVRHPYVMAEIDKPAIRAIADQLGLTDVAELPAAPCLSSRVETGLPIRAESLAAIDQVERDLRAELEPEAVRCRLRAGRVTIELDPDTIDGLSRDTRDRIIADVTAAWLRIGIDHPVTIDRYRQGSAFLRVGS